MNEQVDKLIAGLKEIMYRNPLRNDRQMYEYCLAEWAMGWREEKPIAEDFGLEPINLAEIDKYLEEEE